MAKKFDAKAKAKRQKIILAVLSVVFLGVLAWQVPSVLKMMNEKPAPAPTATPAPAPAPTPGVAPGAGAPISATSAAGQLPDTDPKAQPSGGQLVSFDRFSSKDPFVQQGGPVTATPVTSPPSPPKPSTANSPPPAKQPSGSPASPAAPTSARIAVNGTAEPVSVGGLFPQADPVFVLVSVTATTAKVGISGGSLDSGGSTVTLKKGKRLTLENTVDGARYVLLLVSTG